MGAARAKAEAEQKISQQRAHEDAAQAAAAQIAAQVAEAAAEAQREATQKAVAAAEEAERRLQETKEENERKEADRANYPVPDFLKKALASNKVNIAVTGNSGIGKSSLINFVRKCTKKDAGFAKVGISECT